MQAYKTRATIRPDHKLVLELPKEIPVGEAEVLVLTPEHLDTERAGLIAAFLDGLASRSRATRTKKQIDDDLLSERLSWE